MSEPHEELLSIADNMDRLAERGRQAEIQKPLERLKRAALKIGEAWSGSWLGYHANVYYRGLRPPPPHAYFSRDCGLAFQNEPGSSVGDWIVFKAQAVEVAVHECAGNPDLVDARNIYDEAAPEFDTQKFNVLSILETEQTNSSDSFLKKLKDRIEKLLILTKDELMDRWRPKRAESSDLRAVHQGFWIPPHYPILVEVSVILGTFKQVTDFAKLTRQASQHLLRRQHRQRQAKIVGKNVFIGHGHSQIWRELKDFIKDRLKLSVDEFNRVPVAGMPNSERLLEMLDAAAIAFFLMTGEDEQPDGKVRARENVVHEVGLFQGRLGFRRAIVLLEDGCEEFSNIEGLVHIRFPKGKIQSAFEEIRRVFERENMLSVDENGV